VVRGAYLLAGFDNADVARAEAIVTARAMC
jgi:hypothetical protein